MLAGALAGAMSLVTPATAQSRDDRARDASAELARAELARGVTVIMDQARVMRLPPRVSTIVIGNPLIADATVQAGGIIVLTGKGIGSTNLIALDRSGEAIVATTLTVRPQTNNVVRVFRGIDRETYSCNPSCERTIAVGDVSSFFDGAIAQSGARAQASSGAAPAGR